MSSAVRPESFEDRVLKPRREMIEEAIERYFPRDPSEREIEFVCGKPTYRYDVGALQRAIYTPGWDLLDRGGKRWRPVLMALVIESLGKPAEEFADFLAIPEVVHNGSLVVDDIEDNSKLRRGQPTLHLRYGVDVAINAGNAMYYIPLLPLIKRRGQLAPKTLLDIYEVYVQEMINISHGQATDIEWHRRPEVDVSVDQYLQMCAYKTGTLARMSAKIGAFLAGASDDAAVAFGRFAESLAIAFQIQDDILNLQHSVGKEYGDDITEGKLSLLVIRALAQFDPSRRARLRQILGAHTDAVAEIREAIQLIESTDAFGFSQSVARKLVEESWQSLDALVPAGRAKQDLKEFGEYLVQRSH